MAGVSVPEAAMHEENGFISRKDKIRAPRQTRAAQSVSKTVRMQRAAY
jgi:hypothetical protein